MDLIQASDARHIARFLCKKPVVYAYPLGYLDPKYAEFCQWYASVGEDGEYQAVVLVYNGLSRPALFTCGMPDLIAPVIAHFADELPPRVTARLREHHWTSVLKVYRTPKRQRELSRMSLQRREYDAHRPNELSTADVVRLSHRDTGEIMHLHAHWPDRFFEPSQLDTGLVYGIREPGGSRLISMAAVHNVSEAYDIASISTLVTHPEFRRRGFGRACTARLLDVTFERVSMITLDIDSDNDAARNTYTRFGFREVREFLEAGLRK